MRISAFSMLALGLGLTGIQLAACSNSSDDCNATATCGGVAGMAMAGGGGKSGGGGSGGVVVGGGSGTGGGGGSANSGGQGGEGPSGCEGDVAEDAACWTTNELGVFVSSESGDDSVGNGTKEAPFATLGKGIASAAGKNVYVCLGATKDTYSEQITLGAEQDGTKIYGGFDCTDWSYSTTRKALVKSPNAIGLRIADLQEGVVIENLRIEASSAKNAGESSYGAFIVESKNVVLRRVEITAGDGAKGADGEAAAIGRNGTKSGDDQDGQAADCTAGVQEGAGGEPVADVYGSVGGKGGNGAVAVKGDAGRQGLPTNDVVTPDLDNGGPAATADEPGGNGQPGANGNRGTLGTAAAAAGTFDAAGYKPADGRGGGDGYPGQGGGGGGASKGATGCRGASGGAGGMGGEGGKGGKGGQGGGASVGLFAVSSDVQLISSKVTSGTGGEGGSGGNGGLRGQGVDGGSGGLGSGSIKPGGRGGAGGAGGDGGSGSGGSGGPSYALVFAGTKPVFEAADTTLVAGDGGDGGLGGEVETVKAPDGSAGLAAAELEVK